MFRSLQSLEILDLSRNYLSGFLPTVLAELPGSLHINISFNNFEDLIPYGKAFENIAIKELRGNKGLCSNITGLQLCESPQLSRNHINVKGLNLVLIIVLPLLGSFILLCAFFGAHKICQQRKRKTTENVVHADLFSISTFDGKAMYRELLKANEDFSKIFYIGEGGYGSLYKAMVPPSKLVAVKRLHLLPKKVMEEEAKELDSEKRVNIIKGLAHALSFMHHDCSPSIVHGDISSNNVLLDLEYEARVSVFGIAKFIRKDSDTITEK
ncbi:MDIS1-interacting receptor like kinase 2-like [Coffea arabica]|uniref:non-specific serine/threonine protein kinase n=1 Tax=Coffea arabica TaxID=13443 RepID=A0ABM4X774_COFAR